MTIVRVIPLSEVSVDQVLSLAAGLEQGSAHPIARAFHTISAPIADFDSRRHQVAQGVSGELQGMPYALGKPDFVANLLSLTSVPDIPHGEGLFLLLANSRGVLAWIHLSDEIRPGARAAVTALQQSKVKVELLSGDLSPAVAAVAASLGVKAWHARKTPEDKLNYVHSLQAQGHRVLMVGDGINDVPVLRGADVSLAMGDSADLTRLHADSVLVSGNLSVLPRAIELARMTRRVIGQNLGWALTYNLVALPLACAGLVPPWAAAIGMSASSLLVVVNALRINRMDKDNQTLLTG